MILLAALTGFASLTAAAWIHIKAYVAQAMIADAWRRAGHGETDVHPWPWADTTPVARLIMTSPDPTELVVLEGSSGRNLAFGPVHDPASVLPGERGNSIIAGHRDTHFRFLQDLQVGDRLQVERANGRVIWFVVTGTSVVDSRATRIALLSDLPRLTLVTCYPFDAIEPGGPLRYVVTAGLAPNPVLVQDRPGLPDRATQPAIDAVNLKTRWGR
jgi:sortase A